MKRLLIPLILLALLAPALAVVPTHQQWDGDTCAIANIGDFSDIMNWNPDAMPVKPYDTINYAVPKAGACVSNPVDNIMDPATGIVFTNWEGISNVFPSNQLAIINPYTTGITVGSQNCNSYLGAFGLNIDTQSIAFGEGLALNNNGVGTNNVCINGTTNLRHGWYFSYNIGEDRWYLGENLNIGSLIKSSAGNPVLGCSYGSNLANAPGFYSLNDQTGTWTIQTNDVRDCVFDGSGLSKTTLVIAEDTVTGSSRWDIEGTERTLFKDLFLKWQSNNAADWELVVNNTVTLQNSYAYPDLGNPNDDFDVYVGDTFYVTNASYGPSFVDVLGAIIYNRGLVRVAGPSPTYDENTGTIGTSEWLNDSEIWWDLGNAGATGIWTTSPTSTYAGLSEILVFGIPGNDLEIYPNNIGSHGVTDLRAEGGTDIEITSASFFGKDIQLVSGSNIIMANGGVINITGELNLSSSSTITQLMPGSSLYANSLNVETDSDADITLDNIAIYGDSVLECGDLTAQFGILYTGNIDVGQCTSGNSPSIYGGVDINVQNITDFGDLAGGTPGTFSYCDLDYTSLPGSWSAGIDDQKLGCSPHVVRSLTSPTMGLPYINDSFDFSWTEEYGDLTYSCEVDNQGDNYASTEVTWNTASTNKEVNLVNLSLGNTYVWRCRANNEDGAYGPWSSNGQFTYSYTGAGCPGSANFTIANPLNGSNVNNYNGIDLVLNVDPNMDACTYSWDGSNWLHSFSCSNGYKIYGQFDGNTTLHVLGQETNGYYTCNTSSAFTLYGTPTTADKLEELKVIIGFLVIALGAIWFLFKKTQYAMVGDLLLGAVGLIAAYVYSHVLTWLIAFILLINLLLQFVERLSRTRW
jgi:uncharacterized membrane protein (UPF0136 family)